MTYRIKWTTERTHYREPMTIIGISVYSTLAAAEKQVSRWRQHFPRNSYAIISV